MMLFWIENWYCNGLKILSKITSFQSNMKCEGKTFGVAITDSPVLKNISAANAQYTQVQALIVTDHTWKKNVETFARWSYNYHLPKFTCTT